MKNFIEWLQMIATHATLILGIIVTLRSLYGLFASGIYSMTDRLLSNFFVLFLYTQFITELVLFLTSSFRYEESLKASEHIALTLFATIMTQGGRLITMKSNDNSVKFRFRSIYYGVGTGLLLYAFILVS